MVAKNSTTKPPERLINHPLRFKINHEDIIFHLEPVLFLSFSVIDPVIVINLEQEPNETVSSI